MSSHLQSIDGPTSIFPELTKIVDQTTDSSMTLGNAKFAKLGQKYLSAIVADILLFRLKTPFKDIDVLLDASIAKLIDQRYFKGQCKEKLQIGLGKIFRQKNTHQIHKLQQDIQSFLQIQLSNQQSFSKLLNDISISAIQKKHNNSNILDEDSSDFPAFSELNSFSINGKIYDKILSPPQDLEKHLQEVENYLKDKNGTTQINLLKDYKQKTITLDNKCAVVGTLTRHTVELEFINFLDDSKPLKILATEQGMNKNVAREKASKLMLTKFFSTYPFIFKDYLHCMKIKGK